MNTYVIGKYVGSNVGGAELSSNELAKSFSQNSSINIRLSNIDNFRGNKIQNHKEFKTINYPKYKFLSLFSVYYAPYFYHKFQRKNIIKELQFIKEEDIAIGVGIESVPVLLELKCKCIFVARSPNDLSITPIYGFHFLKIKRIVKSVIDFIPSLLFKKLLLKYISSKKEFAVNSQFMQNLASKKLGLKKNKIKIYLPKPQAINEKVNLKKYTKESNIRLIMVGNDECKGISIFKKISKTLRKIEYHGLNYENICISRKHFKLQYSKKNNIFYYPWGQFFKLINKNTIVIIPSFWEEAYCRVAKECNILDIPVIAFKRGGIPEALHGHKRCILLKYSNDVNQWIESIQKLSSNCY